MRDKQLHTPEGVRDIHCNEALKKHEIQRRIMAVFHHYGFLDVQTPTFEYIDVFSHDSGTIDIKNMYKFFDSDGNILVMRPDITPSVARMMATGYHHENTPKRFCYLGNAFRNIESYQLKLREFTQAGVELIGIDSEDADAEIIAIVIQSLLAVGLKDFQIDIGQAGFFKGLLEEAGLDSKYEEELRMLIDQKNYIAVEELLDSLELDQAHKKVLLDLPKFFGDVKVIEQAKSTTMNKKALAALDRLERIYNILCDYKVEQYISFDLGMVSQINYYTGIVFRGYTFGTGVSIVDGGRYDTLLQEFGHSAPAVGFAIIVDEVMNSIERQHIEIDVPSTDTLLLYNLKSRTMAISIADRMRREGMRIEIGMLDRDLEENIAYGKKNHIGGIMNFLSLDEVELVNLETEERNTVDVKSLF
ncbi:ATP phosphoribosyltransferase regulatory subunit [Petrocella atlantisensis]|uniref:ATP phosphoribosyltransferase regulatory subunit n=1 Tax=Petrocella atlantisensis TaxID=2173034 RepID=A0A3P7NSQ8_9FIRM|nr:ATP phosphoribosyltransferase regulatory subunit [Petrocella atlantisensis]PKM53973.1 MAG: ATP phosphoribosyltransferase regulatory subunit [Firmicutes bacterium HGW-Firmicutes-5]VDN45935.1 ATP phosphoribosyltransferase regulatory subunit [Petrocella atlantisensis]